MKVGVLIFFTIKFYKKAVPYFLAGFLVLFLGLKGANSTMAVMGDMPEPEKVVYLTFDDGPSYNTERLLDILEEENVKATFFVINNTDEGAKELVYRAFMDGHTIGAHSASHNYNLIYKTPEGYLDDLEKNEQYIESIIGQKPVIMRFPGGSANRGAPLWLRAQITQLVAQKGYTYYDWSAVSGDDTAVVYAADVLLKNVIREAGNANEIVVLFHDTALARTTPEAAKLVIDYYRAKGYVFKAITPDVTPIQFYKAKQS